MLTLTAILAGKTISYLSKLLKLGGGSAAPGLYALKIQPDLVEKLCKQIPRNIIITGTNGKTTTARMLAHFAKEAGLKVIRNHTGSNLERGIASTLINSYSHLSSRNVDLGIWELDEAAFNPVVPKIKPDIIIFLNVFRDQLDRYGEVDTVVKKWTRSLRQIDKHTIILINGDDRNLSNLKKGFYGKIESFGVKGSKIKGELTASNKYPLNKINYLAKEIQQEGLKGTYFQLLKEDFFLPLPGIYHVYDAVAAIICAHKLRIPLNILNKTFKTYSPAFGRVEKLDFGYIFLIKNPAGTTQVFETITPQIKKNDRLLIALNDNLADGTDVSWIWDANFEILSQIRQISITISGTRAADLAVRLKYGGFDPKQIKVESDLKKALRGARTGLKGRLFILPTYTAMLELQSILTKMGIKKNYWEEA